MGAFIISQYMAVQFWVFFLFGYTVFNPNTLHTASYLPGLPLVKVERDPRQCFRDHDLAVLKQTEFVLGCTQMALF